LKTLHARAGRRESKTTGRRQQATAETIWPQIITISSLVPASGQRVSALRIASSQITNQESQFINSALTECILLIIESNPDPLLNWRTK
jgi:hypothetical protein